MTKRQKNADGRNPKVAKAETGGRKKGRKAPEKVEEEDRKDGCELKSAAVENLVGVWDDELFPLLKGDVDEQMSWGSIWLPIWDVEYYMGQACGEMLSDDDIWNLKSIDKIPNP